MVEMQRRRFLKIGAAAAVGVTTGYIWPYLGRETNSVTARITNRPSGNAGVRQKIEEACNNDRTRIQNCADNFQFSDSDKVNGILVSPLSEELIFRAVPSALLSIVEDSNNPIDDVLVGTDGAGMTRRELILGIITSVTNAAMHNVTSKGIDMETIPASQTLAALTYWYLQRKLGLLANTLAHTSSNLRIMMGLV